MPDLFIFHLDIIPELEEDIVITEGSTSFPMTISKKAKLNFLTGIFITAIMAILLLVKSSPIETIEEKLYDYRFTLRGTVRPPENIVIAAIDERSIAAYGRWPWSRDRLAELTDRLTDTGAEMIVFDILFSEKEKHDRILGKAIKRAGNVLLPVAFDFDRESKEGESELLIRSGFQSIQNPELFNKHNPIRARGVLTPVPDLIRETMALGHINMFPDGDGVLRWEAMAVEFNGYLYPSIDLQAAAKYSGVPPEKVILRATEGVYLGKRYIETDKRGRALIHYYGPQKTFPYLSVLDILKGHVTPEQLQGKIVLIGPTAMGIYDLRVTPFSPVMPGVEKHANLIASILESRFIHPASVRGNMLLLLLSGILMSLLVARFKAIGASAITGAILLPIASAGYFALVRDGLWLNIAYPMINVLAIFVSVTAYNYAVEERYARRIRAMFSSYVTERIVNELIKNPGMAKLGGERREVTVLFTDVRGFASFSEKHTPEEVVAILNEYLGAMTEVIFRWEGTLDKFIGDAILAFWGAPMWEENHAELAVRCALDMTRRLRELQEKWRWEGKPVLDAGIGINTGNVVVGNIGAEGKKMDYTVIGDHVNLGARVEALTRKYGAQILITEFTMERIEGMIKEGRLGHVKTKGLEKVTVKGKDKEVGIYEMEPLPHPEQDRKQ